MSFDEKGPSAQEVEPKKKFMVRAEMEAWGKDGSAIDDLWREVNIEVEAEDDDDIDDEIVDKLFDMDFGNAKPTGRFEKTEI
ncbi:MAG: hypothetical protein WC663_01495 [Patescibacteria group bacterium]|jgi:hypothetical protein